MKKLLAKLLLALAFVFTLVPLVSCENNDQEGSKTEDKVTLTTNEQNLVDAITIKLISQFKDPGSVKVITVNASYCNSSIVILKFSAVNSFGGSVTNEIVIATKDVNTFNYITSADTDLNVSYIPKGTFEETDKISVDNFLNQTKLQWTLFLLTAEKHKDKTCSYNVGNVNNALNDYKKTQGWA